MNPHPSKIHKGGEDAYGISENNRLLTMTDGVGGWADSGVDTALYSRELCQIMTNFSDIEKRFIFEPKDNFIEAVAQNYQIGSCTCVAMEIDEKLAEVKTVNLGDSGYLWLRKQGIDLIIQHESKRE
mgnify:CR=1 FL=1